MENAKRNLNLKLPIVALAGVLLALTLALTACSSAGSEENKVTVAASPTPHAQILNEAVAPILEEEGITLEVVEFNDYVLPNTATEEGDVDANYFQHITYLNQFNEDRGTHLTDVVAVHFEPLGLYSDKLDSLADLPDGAKIAVPNDPTNEARALLLLEQEGLIEVDDAAGINATELDVTSNPKNLEFIPTEAANIPNVLPDVDLAAINGNYAIGAGLDTNAALAVEETSGLAAQNYANVLVVKEGNENNENIQALAKALTSDQVRAYLEENYPGAVVAVF